MDVEQLLRHRETLLKIREAMKQKRKLVVPGSKKCKEIERFERAADEMLADPGLIEQCVSKEREIIVKNRLTPKRRIANIFGNPDHYANELARQFCGTDREWWGYD